MSRWMIDVQGIVLTDEDKSLLKHPSVGGVILFARNCQSPEQVKQLTHSIREVKGTVPGGDSPLIAIDQEGGRVERLKTGFTHLPPMRRFGEIYDQNQAKAQKLAKLAGFVMACEVLSVGIDFSFAPVLDLDKGISQVIGDRAFHQDPAIVTQLARQFVAGMKEAGMQPVGKHFPGHGSVKADSHLELPQDLRTLDQIKKEDMQPFINLIQDNLSAIMPAHIVFPKIDSMPVGFSNIWLQEILRKQLHFTGAIFSDDLSMKATEIVGDYKARAKLALDAGCDMILICNNRKAVLEMVETIDIKTNSDVRKRLNLMQGKLFHYERLPLFKEELKRGLNL